MGGDDSENTAVAAYASIAQEQVEFTRNEARADLPPDPPDRALLGQPGLDRGEREGAVDDALEAERLSEPLDTPPFESPRYRGEILLAAARILQSVGRREDALRRAVAAAGQFEKKADLVSAGRARELAAALRVGSESEPDAAICPAPVRCRLRARGF